MADTATGANPVDTGTSRRFSRVRSALQKTRQKAEKFVRGRRSRETSPGSRGSRNSSIEGASAPRSSSIGKTKAKIKDAFRIAKFRLKSGSYDGEVIVAGERVRLDETDFDPKRYIDVVSFKEKYLYRETAKYKETEKSGEQIAKGVDLFSRYFGSKSNFDEKNPQPPCEAADRELLLSLLNDRLDSLRSEVRFLYLSGMDSIYMRQKMDHFDRLKSLIDLLEQRIELDTSECSGQPRSAQLQMEATDEEMETIRRLLRKFAVLIMQKKEPHTGEDYQGLVPDATRIVNEVEKVQLEPTKLDSFATSWETVMNRQLPPQIRRILFDIQDADVDANVKGELIKIRDIIWSSMDNNKSITDRGWPAEKEKLEEPENPDPKQQVIGTLDWLIRAMTAMNNELKSKEDEKAAVQGELDNSKTRIGELETQLQNMTQMSGDKEDDMNALNAKLAEEQENSKKLGEENENLTNEINRLKGELEATKNTLRSVMPQDQAGTLDELEKANRKLAEQQAELSRIHKAMEKIAQDNPGKSPSEIITILLRNMEDMRGMQNADAAAQVSPSMELCFLSYFIAYFNKLVFYGSAVGTEKRKLTSLLSELENMVNSTKISLKTQLDVVFDCLQAAEDFLLKEPLMTKAGYYFVKHGHNGEKGWTLKIEAYNDAFEKIYNQFEGKSGEFLTNLKAAADIVFSKLSPKLADISFRPRFKTDNENTSTWDEHILSTIPTPAKYPSFIYTPEEARPTADPHYIFDMDLNGDITKGDNLTEDWKNTLEQKINDKDLTYEGLFMYFLVLAKNYLKGKKSEMGAMGCPLPSVLDMKPSVVPTSPALVRTSSTSRGASTVPVTTGGRSDIDKLATILGQIKMGMAASIKGQLEKNISSNTNTETSLNGSVDGPVMTLINKYKLHSLQFNALATVNLERFDTKSPDEKKTLMNQYFSRLYSAMLDKGKEGTFYNFIYDLFRAFIKQYKVVGVTGLNEKITRFFPTYRDFILKIVIKRNPDKTIGNYFKIGAQQLKEFTNGDGNTYPSST